MLGRGHNLLNIERHYMPKRRKTGHINGIPSDVLYHRMLKLDIYVGIFFSNCDLLCQNIQKSFLPLFKE